MERSKLGSGSDARAIIVAAANDQMRHYTWDVHAVLHGEAGRKVRDRSGRSRTFSWLRWIIILNRACDIGADHCVGRHAEGEPHCSLAALTPTVMGEWELEVMWDSWQGLPDASGPCLNESGNHAVVV